MSRRKKLLVTAGSVLALGAGGVGVAVGAGGDDGAGQPITGSALEKASAAALAHAGGGQVTGSEVRDEEGYYEIEVTRPDGSQVDVHLDRGFHVTNSSADGEGVDDSD